MNALDKARQAREEMRANGTLRVKNPVEKLADHPGSLRAAITAKCWQCEGEGADPGVKGRVGACTIRECALWGVRPWQPRA
jgi:hypothetical protein